jgi:tetratricopeptide (TPR) repeat protein
MVALTAATTEPNAAQAHEQARALFDRAEINFNLGNFREAMADYQSAYQAEPLPGFVFNIAQCYRNLDDYDHASFFFRRYLTLDRASPRRGQVEALIVQMDAQRKKAGDPARVLARIPAQPAGYRQPMALDAAALPAPGPANDEHRGVTHQWWFWVTLGGVLAASTLTTALLLDRDHQNGGPPPIDGRSK